MECSNFIILFFEKQTSCANEYISTIIGGLYGLTLISITVFSLISNITEKKTLGLSPISLLRYNVYVLLSPLYILTTYIFLMIIFPNYFDNIYGVLTLAIIITIYITFQAKLILQPFYKKEVFKNAIINKQILMIKKEYKKYKNNSRNKFDEFFIGKLKMLTCYKSSDSYFDEKDVENIWTEYINVLMQLEDNVSEKVKYDIVQIGFDIFGNKIIKMDSSTILIKEELVEDIVRYKLNGYSRELFKFVFDSMHDIYEYYKITKKGFEKYDELLMEYLEVIFFDNSYINLLFECVLDKKLNIEDAEYISIYISNIIIMSKQLDYSEICKSEYVMDQITYILNCANDTTKFNGIFGEDFDEFIKSCLILKEKRLNND